MAHRLISYGYILIGNTMAHNVEKRAGLDVGSPEEPSPQSEPRDPTIVCGQSRAARHANLVIFGLAVFMMLAVCVSLMLGRYPIEPAQAIGMLVNAIPASTSSKPGPTSRPRCSSTCDCRASSSRSSWAAPSPPQARLSRNVPKPARVPDILGASQGAAFGAAVAILIGSGAFAVSMSAFGFSILTVMLVLLISSRAKGNRILITVLAGTMISSLFSAGVSFTKLVADPTDQLPAITYWLMGSLTGAKMSDIALAAIPMAIGMVILFVLRWRINILTMGDDEASTMGINARRLRLFIIIAATMATAASVAISGMIGWVGLVVPHLCRMIVGSDYRKLIPASMLFGASFLLVVDNIARLASTAEIPIGILTAFVGAPFFLYLITRKKKVQPREHRNQKPLVLPTASTRSCMTSTCRSPTAPGQRARPQRRREVDPVPLHLGAQRGISGRHPHQQGRTCATCPSKSARGRSPTFRSRMPPSTITRFSTWCS